MLYIPDIGIYSEVVGVRKFREAEQSNAMPQLGHLSD